VTSPGVLAATQRLVLLSERHGWTVRGIEAEAEHAALADLIRELGTAADEAFLRPRFLADPAARLPLLPLLAALGTEETARDLAAACCPEGRLADGLPGRILLDLGRLGLQSARDMLWTYAREPWHETGKQACLGLLDLDCAGLEQDIEAAIRACSRQERGLFPEYLPALAGKTGNPDLVSVLLELGRTSPVDNRGGILIGLATLGAAGAAAFETVLADPTWEAADYPTGTWIALHRAVLASGIGADSLWSRFLAGKTAGEAPDLLRYRLECLLAVLDAELATEAEDLPRALSGTTTVSGALLSRLAGEAGPGLLDDEVLACLDDGPAAYDRVSGLMDRLEARYREQCRWAALRREMGIARGGRSS
jgi:hypothetical protein